MDGATRRVPPPIAGVTPQVSPGQLWAQQEGPLSFSASSSDRISQGGANPLTTSTERGQAPSNAAPSPVTTQQQYALVSKSECAKQRGTAWTDKGHNNQNLDCGVQVAKLPHLETRYYVQEYV